MSDLLNRFLDKLKSKMPSRVLPFDEFDAALMDRINRSLDEAVDERAEESYGKGFTDGYNTAIAELKNSTKI